MVDSPRDVAVLQKEIDRCSKCGGCQAYCPVYEELRVETAVARGRVYLLSRFLEGNLEISDKFAEIMALCLLCKNCVANCPNGVAVDKLVLAARREIVTQKGLPPLKRIIFHHVLTSPRRLNLLTGFAKVYQRSGLRWLVRQGQAFPGLSGLVAKENLLPEIAGQSLRQSLPSYIKVTGAKRRVAYFTGCMTNYVFQNTGLALVNVLQQNGVEVMIPEQYCCGVPAETSGDLATAQKLAKANIDAFAPLQVDTILTDCPSCAVSLREYGEKLGSKEAWEFSAKVRDITEFLTKDIELKKPEGSLPVKVTYHDPCHALRGLNLKEEPRELLKMIPELKLAEMDGPPKCCGSAGSFNLSHYELSMRILDKKLNSIKKTGAETVVTACPACRIQISHGLKQSKQAVTVVHPLELLSQSYAAGPRGEKPPTG